MKISETTPNIIQSLEVVCNRIRIPLSRIFSVLTAIKNDGFTTIQFLRVSRFAIFALKAYYGKLPGSSIVDQDLEKAMSTLEGLQFIGVISYFLPTKKNQVVDEDKRSLNEKVTMAAFMASDSLSGVAWVISRGIPVFGSFSELALVALEITALATALIGFISDGGAALKTISRHWKISIPDKTVAIWQICERVTGSVALTLILIGATGTFATIATTLSATSAFCGVVRFTYKLDLEIEKNQSDKNKEVNKNN